MIPWPKLLGGSSNPLAVWLNRFLGCAKQCEPLSIEGYRIEHGAIGGGWNAKKVFQNSSGKAGASSPLSVKLMAIKSLGSSLNPALPDLLICSAATAQSGSFGIGVDTVYVAKAKTMRRVVKEIFFDDGANVTQAYSYFGPTPQDHSYGDNFRQASDGTQSELESATPRYYTSDMMLSAAMPVDQSLIYVIDTGSPTGVVDPNGANVTKIEFLPARMWSKVVNS
jgi:hypothetical protein